MGRHSALQIPAPAMSETPVHSKRRRLVRLGLRMGAAVSLLGAAALAVAMTITTIAVPNPMALRKDEQAPVIRVLAHDGTVLAERGQHYDYIPVDFLPRHVTDAVIATEDRRFNEHWGVDPWGLARAVFANLRAGRYAQGGSTLTQQLAKNLFLSSERRISRKLEELYLSLWLELRLTKSDILELYLNRVYFGGGAYGIEAAAQRYFDKSARSLTIAEGAVLAGLLKAPSKFSPLSSPSNARRRARIVVAKMHDAGFITEAQKAEALAQEIRFYDPPSSRDPTGFEYAVDYVLERLPSLQANHVRVLNIETTIDATLQRTAQTLAAQLIGTEGSTNNVTQVGALLMSPTGEIRAMVGGANHAESQFNRATRARRQPGSAFKPFVYLAAVEAGMTADSPVFDLPVMIGGYAPRNESGTYQGQTTLRTALAQSINSVAVRLHVDNGPLKTVAVANRLGVRIEQRDSPSTALGTSETSLLELTSAYAVFANGGDAVEPHIIRRISTESGERLYQRPEQRVRRIVTPHHVGIMSDMLNATLVSGTGRRAALAHHPAAGKTGTSQDFRDAWFVGYTAHYVGGIWLGNDNGRSMNRIAGGSLPARLWHDLLTAAHSGKPPRALPGTRQHVEPAAASETGDPIGDLVNRLDGSSAQKRMQPKTSAPGNVRSFIDEKVRTLPVQTADSPGALAATYRTTTSTPRSGTPPTAQAAEAARNEPITQANPPSPTSRQAAPAGMMALGARN